MPAGPVPDLPRRRTRLAPSPTGALHLGNARTFLVNWALARQQGWEVVLRIDDLDGPRVKAGADIQAIEILQWLGLDWDQEPRYQTACLATYRTALNQLARQGGIYPCQCTRSQIQAAQSAPHAGEHELRYPGTCRPTRRMPVNSAALDQPDVAWRLFVAEGEQSFVDQFAGRVVSSVQAEIGDFVVATKQGLPSYQLAVVVDDWQQQITDVVRGDDLLSSTPRQQLLYDALQLGPTPRYWHLPLIVGHDGRRLAKRHGDSRLMHFRDLGVSSTRVIGLLGDWCGIRPRREMNLDAFLADFDLGRLPRQAIVYGPEDEQWLLA